MEFGDYFTTFSWLVNFAVIQMRKSWRVDNDAGYYPRKPGDTLRTFAKEFVKAHPPDRHELVAAFDGGLVYVLNDWVKHP